MKVRVTKKVSDGIVDIPIHTEYIKLQDFLKFCNAVESGGMAKNFIVNEEVEVNGETCTMRGKKLRPGDSVCSSARTRRGKRICWRPCSTSPRAGASARGGRRS